MNSDKKTTPSANHKHSRTRTVSNYSVPFSKVKLEMGDLNYWVNTESSDIWKRHQSQEPNVPIGMKDYDPVAMREIPRSHKFKEDESKDKYMKVISNNPNVFFRKSGIFTDYINCAVKANKVGPYARKKPSK